MEMFPATDGILLIDFCGIRGSQSERPSRLDASRTRSQCRWATAGWTRRNYGMSTLQDASVGANESCVFQHVCSCLLCCFVSLVFFFGGGVFFHFTRSPPAFPQPPSRLFGHRLSFLTKMSMYLDLSLLQRLH